MFVRQIMSPPALVRGDAPLAEVARVMLARQASCVGVLDDQGRLCGVILDEDFVPQERLVPFSTERVPRLFGQWVSRGHIVDAYVTVRDLTAGSAMRPIACCPSGEQRLEDWLEPLSTLRCLPVVNGGTIVGMITPRELLRTVP
jgi:CBS domain-containing protein